MKIKKNTIIRLEKYLLELGFEIKTDNKKYPFKVFGKTYGRWSKHEIDKELKIPRIETLDYKGSDNLVIDTINTISKHFDLDFNYLFFKLTHNKSKKIKIIATDKYVLKLCPICKVAAYGNDNNYCWNCGQELDWSEIDEKLNNY